AWPRGFALQSESEEAEMTGKDEDRKQNDERADTERQLGQTDFAQAEMGRNSLQGNDQSDIRNERRATPSTKPEADDVLDSFRKLDKDVRAREDLGKGARRPSGGAGGNDNEEE